MNEQRFPKGWDEERVKRLIAELDARTDEEWIAADEAAADRGDPAIIPVPDARVELIEALRSLANTAPGVRVGQLMAAVGEVCRDLHGRGLWDADDQELLEAIWRFRRDVETSLPAAVHPDS